MALMAEVGIKQINKMGEELCGDTVEVIYKREGLVMVLSDGMGSGVKANILSTLTAQIASKMISADVHINNVVETLIDTLPVCSERGLAYSTFTIIRLYNNGWAHIVDFDGCEVIHIRNDGIGVVEQESYDVAGRTIHEANIRLEEGEALVAVSDGVMHAGLGTMFPAGLDAEGLVDILHRYVDVHASPKAIADRIVSMCNSFYFEEPLDDVTAVVMRVVEERRLVLMTGPPRNRENDAEFVAAFQSMDGRKAIAGGTTSQIYARESGNPLHMDKRAIENGRSPTGLIKGAELVTEGVLTLNEVVHMLKTGQAGDKDDASTLLLKELLDAHHIIILQGMRENPAYKGDQSLGFDLRQNVLLDLVELLEQRGKIVDINTF